MMNIGIVRWMRRVIPRGDFVTVVVIVEMLIECTYLWNLWRFGFADENAFRWARFLWLTNAAFVYGTYRIIGFHPVANPDYRAWLEQTPWTADQPLPGGPLQLVPQDLVVICGLMVLYRTPSIWMLYFPTAFLVGYQIMLAFCARIIGHWKLAYLLAFGLGLVLYLIDHPEAAFAAADGCFIIGRIAVSRALRTFPWDVPWQVDVRTFKARTEEELRRRLGWPYDQIKPIGPERVIPIRDGICVSFLAGWWWFAFLNHLAPEPRFMLPGMVSMAFFVAAFVRPAIYMLSHRPPISFFGRIFTLRWIIPGYDKIFVAPILAFVVGGTLQGAGMQMLNPQGFAPAMNPLPGMAVSGLGVAASLLLLLVAGPQLESWRMTGKHRIVFDLAGFEKLQKNEHFVEL